MQSLSDPPSTQAYPREKCDSHVTVSMYNVETALCAMNGVTVVPTAVEVYDFEICFCLQELLSRTSLETQKLNLMTEVSELKLKLVGMEKEQKEQEEKQKKAEVSAINHILGRTHTALSSDQGKLS